MALRKFLTNIDIEGQLVVKTGTDNNKITVVTQNAALAIGDEFTDITTKSYINFAAATGNNDPGFIMHESGTVTADLNKGVLHLCPTDDSSSTGDYVSIHGTNDPENLKLYTSGYATFAGVITALEGNSTAWNEAKAHSILTSGNPHSVTKTDVGLGNVENAAASGLYLLNTTDTLTGNLTVTGSIRTNSYVASNQYRSDGNQQLVINAGESYNVTIPSGQEQTDEYVYINAEQGLRITSSPDNWLPALDAWSRRNETTINDVNGDSSFARNISAGGTVLGSNLSGTNTGDQDLSGYAGVGFNQPDVLSPTIAPGGYGFFYAASDAINKPLGGTWVGGMQWIDADNLNYRNVLVSDSSELYFNKQSNGSWGGWQKVITNTNIGSNLPSNIAYTDVDNNFSEGQTITSDDGLYLKATTNGVGVDLKFSDHSAGGYAQIGTIRFAHSDTLSYGSGSAFIIGTTEATSTILADGKLMYGEGIYSKPATGTGAGIRKDLLWDSVVNYLPLAGGVMTGDVTFTTDGQGIIFSTAMALNTGSGNLITGGPDGANNVKSNITLRSWYGVGFACGVSGQTIPLGENAVYFNTRTGVGHFRGSLSSGGDLSCSGIITADGSVNIGTVPYNSTSITALVADEVLGENVVLNSGFDTIDNWTVQGTWEISGGTANTVAGSDQVYQSNRITVGKTYSVTFTITSYTSGTFRPILGATGGTARTAVGTYTEQITCTSNTNLGIQVLSSGTGSIDNVSVREVIEVGSTQVQKRVLGSNAFESVDLQNLAYTDVDNDFSVTQTFDNGSYAPITLQRNNGATDNIGIYFNSANNPKYLNANGLDGYLHWGAGLDSSLNPIVIIGEGTTNYVPKFTDEGTLGNSLIHDSGTSIGIGINGQSSTFAVRSSGTNNQNVLFSFSQGGLRHVLATNASDNGYIDLYNGTTTKAVSISSGGNSYFNGGNVGIGTTLPLNRLDLRNGGVVSTNLTTAKSEAVLLLRPVDTLDLYMGISSSGTDTISLQAFNGVTTTGRNIAIQPFGGSVGIGTTSPGTINTVAFSSVGLHVKAGTLGRTITEGTSFGEFIMNHSGASVNARTKYIQSGSGYLKFGSYDDNGTERNHMAINNAGNVLIGTTTDDGVNKLQVNGAGWFGGSVTATQLIATEAIKVYSVAGNETFFSMHDGAPSNTIFDMIRQITGEPSNQIDIRAKYGNIAIWAGSGGTSSKSATFSQEGLTSTGYVIGSSVVNSGTSFQNTKVDGFGMIGNRTAMYVTNQHATGIMQFAVGSIHGSGTNRIRLTANGVRIGDSAEPTQMLDILGNGIFSGTITSTDFIGSSDRRLKTKIEDYTVKPINVRWREYERIETGESEIGVIADELEQEHPEFVVKGKTAEDMDAVRYTRLLIAKVAEQEARIERLEKLIKNLI